MTKDPALRLQGNAVCASHFFEGVDWEEAKARALPPPWVPGVGKDDLKHHKKRTCHSNTFLSRLEDEGSFDGFSFYVPSKTSLLSAYWDRWDAQCPSALPDRGLA